MNLRSLTELGWEPALRVVDFFETAVTAPSRARLAAMGDSADPTN
jgi:hypothetical protein